MAPSSKPVLVIVPGAAQTPSHYAYLSHLLLSQGYGVLSALLPTIGATAPVTAQDDADYIRSRMLLPILDIEKHNVIVISHSYSGMPTSAAVRGLDKVNRTAEGKTTSVLGQIFLASILPRGGDGKDVVATFGGQLPPHIQVDVGKPFSGSFPYLNLQEGKSRSLQEEENLIRCEDPKPPLYQDVSPVLAEAAVLSTICPCLTSFKSPCPAATWDAEAFKGRCAYIRTLNDRAVPYEVQNMMLAATEEEWITKDIETGHNPQLAAPEQLSSIILELVKHFEGM